MGLGQVVHLKGNNETDFWVLMEENRKTCKGVTRTKVFKKLPNQENVMPQSKPYTKARLESSFTADLKQMNRYEAKEYNRLKSLRFIEMLED